MSSSITPDSEPADETLPTARIIPFPVRAQPAEIQPAETQPADSLAADRATANRLAGERLARALESLNAAMAEQKAALAKWREALGTLQTSTSGLGESLQRYQANLGTLGGNVDALRDKAVSLEQWADEVLAK
jgi:hypothetical protein